MLKNRCSKTFEENCIDWTVFFRRRPSAPNFLKPDGQLAFRVRVRTAKHGEVVELRLSKSGDISPTKDGYFVRKHIVGSRSLDRAVLEVHFGPNYSTPQLEVTGAEAIPVSDWE